MKNQNWIQTGILLVGLTLTLSSCYKSSKDDPKPTTTNPPPLQTTTESSTLCGDTICQLPFRVLSNFIPSGFYDTGEQSTTLTIDSCGETPKYAGEGMRIVYTCNGGWGWGAHFLNNNNWGGTYKVNPKATKMTFYVRSNYSANVTFNAFADVQYGKVELYKLGTPITPVWEKITINLLGKPASFNAPLNIVIDGVSNGQVTVVDIKDVLIE